ncbi:MAG TPA: type III pantothenate kinase [Pyrinomonadaceae bacterium]|nr:type III pantothenate kinase [Pyrinomonadaceae bacterium]
MLLVIDAGNTNITLGVFQQEELIVQWRLTTDPVRTGDEYGVQARNLFELAGIDFKNIDAIIIASVVPSLNQTLTRVAEVYFELPPLFVDHTTDTGLKILYEPPSDVGADRIVDAVAAVTKYGAPCIVVDFGTATTFNVINAAGEYLGGVIAPGIMISSEALFARAAKLPRVEIKRPHKVIGSSTTSAMQSGIYHGYAGLVDGVLEQLIAELGTKPRVIATGGLAPLIATASKFIEEVDSNLTLEGLRLIHSRSSED